MKNCVFQYADCHGDVFYDTDLISKEEADELWEKCIPDFIQKMEDGDDPEMAIWVDMDESFSYRKTAKHIRAEDLIVRDGELYELVKVEY